MIKWCAILVFGIAAVVDDLARRKISNWIPAAAVLFGVGFQLANDSWRGGLAALLGILIGAAVFLVFYIAGGMGGGDIKLMAGFGAILGANGILVASLWTALVGGLMALGLVLWTTVRRNIGRSQGTSGVNLRHESLPYAPAIAVGVWLSQLAS